MKIILSGSTGFLGSLFLSEWKNNLDVFAVGRSSRNSMVTNQDGSFPQLPSADLIVHAAGKAHSVPVSRAEGQEFFETNVNGTQKLLEALTATSPLPKSFVFISTVSVYGREEGDEIDETSTPLATDAYGLSKSMAENCIIEWGAKHGVKTTILRLPLVMGPRPKGNLQSMINAIDKGFYFRPGDGSARKSVVDAGDLVRFIPSLVESEGVYNLTSGYHPTLAEIDTAIAHHFGKKIRSIPRTAASLLAHAGDLIPILPINSNRYKKITQSLTFSDRKARESIGWKGSFYPGLNLF